MVSSPSSGLSMSNSVVM